MYRLLLLIALFIVTSCSVDLTEGTTKNNTVPDTVLDGGEINEGIVAGSWIEVEQGHRLILFQNDSVYIYSYNGTDSTYSNDLAETYSSFESGLTFDSKKVEVYYEDEVFIPYSGEFLPKEWVLAGSGNNQEDTTTEKPEDQPWYNSTYILVEYQLGELKEQVPVKEALIISFSRDSAHWYRYDSDLDTTYRDVWKFKYTDTFMIADGDTTVYRVSGDSLIISVGEIEQTDVIYLRYTGEIPHPHWTAADTATEVIDTLIGVDDTLSATPWYTKEYLLVAEDWQGDSIEYAMHERTVFSFRETSVMLYDFLAPGEIDSLEVDLSVTGGSVIIDQENAEVTFRNDTMVILFPDFDMTFYYIEYNDGLPYLGWYIYDTGIEDTIVLDTIHVDTIPVDTIPVDTIAVDTTAINREGFEGIYLFTGLDMDGVYEAIPVSESFIWDVSNSEIVEHDAIGVDTHPIEILSDSTFSVESSTFAYDLNGTELVITFDGVDMIGEVYTGSIPHPSWSRSSRAVFSRGSRSKRSLLQR